jgi:hypothetical protein
MTAKGLLGHRDSPQRIRDYCATLKLNLAAGDHTQVLTYMHHYCYMHSSIVSLSVPIDYCPAAAAAVCAA